MKFSIILGATVLNVSRSGRICRKSNKYEDFSTIGRTTQKKSAQLKQTNTSVSKRSAGVTLKTAASKKRQLSPKEEFESSSEEEINFDEDVDDADSFIPSDNGSDSECPSNNDTSDSDYDVPIKIPRGRPKAPASKRKLAMESKRQVSNQYTDSGSSSDKSIGNGFIIRPKKIEDMMCPEARTKLVDLNTIALRCNSHADDLCDFETGIETVNKTAVAKTMKNRAQTCLPAVVGHRSGPDWTSEFTKFINQKSSRL